MLLSGGGGDWIFYFSKAEILAMAYPRHSGSSFLAAAGQLPACSQMSTLAFKSCSAGTTFPSLIAPWLPGRLPNGEVCWQKVRGYKREKVGVFLSLCCLWFLWFWISSWLWLISDDASLCGCIPHWAALALDSGIPNLSPSFFPPAPGQKWLPAVAHVWTGLSSLV